MLFNVRCVLFHFFYAIVKFCVVFVEEIILRAIPVKYGQISTEITNYIPPVQDIIVKAMDCGIMINKFEVESRYYIHFGTNTLGKGMNPLILLAMD